MAEGGFIYVIGAVGAPYVKIGSTRGTMDSIAKRLKRLQIGHPLPLAICARVGIDHDVQSLEKALHQILTAHCQRGEWLAIAINQEMLEDLVVQASQWYKPDSIGEAIRRYRQQRGMSQRQLAIAAKIPPALLSQIESGKRPGAHIQLAVASRLAFVLHVSLDTLTGGPLEMEKAA